MTRLSFPRHETEGQRKTPIVRRWQTKSKDTPLEVKGFRDEFQDDRFFDIWRHRSNARDVQKGDFNKDGNKVHKHFFEKVRLKRSRGLLLFQMSSLQLYSPHTLLPALAKIKKKLQLKRSVEDVIDVAKRITRMKENDERQRNSCFQWHEPLYACLPIGILKWLALD